MCANHCHSIREANILLLHFDAVIVLLPIPCFSPENLFHVILHYPSITCFRSHQHWLNDTGHGARKVREISQKLPAGSSDQLKQYQLFTINSLLVTHSTIHRRHCTHKQHKCRYVREVRLWFISMYSVFCSLREIAILWRRIPLSRRRPSYYWQSHN